MTREQEIITMGAHAARPNRQHRPTVARLAATTLTVAVTGTLGAGTALAHDGWGDDGGHGSYGSHGSHDEHGSHSGLDEGERAAEQARERVRDVLDDLGMSDRGSQEDPDDEAGTTRTTTQPIAATSDVPPAGVTQTFPIR